MQAGNFPRLNTLHGQILKTDIVDENIRRERSLPTYTHVPLDVQLLERVGQVSGRDINFDRAPFCGGLREKLKVLRGGPHLDGVIGGHLLEKIAMVAHVHGKNGIAGTAGHIKYHTWRITQHGRPDPFIRNGKFCLVIVGLGHHDGVALEHDAGAAAIVAVRALLPFGHGPPSGLAVQLVHLGQRESLEIFHVVQVRWDELEFLHTIQKVIARF